MKNKLKRLATLLLALAMAMSLLQIAALAAETDPLQPTVPAAEDESDTPATSGECGENLKWEYNISTKTLTISGSGPMEEYGSEGIGLPPWLPLASEIEHVVISKGVTTIGASAFSSSFDPNSIEYAITSVEIPNSVTKISSSAFSGCKKMTTLSLKNGLETIDGHAFIGCWALKNVDIPDSVTTIGVSAFAVCRELTNVKIGSGVTNIAHDVFGSCHKLTAIDVSSSNRVFSDHEGVLYNKNKTKLITFPGGKAGNYAIPNTTTTIGNFAFAECSKVTGIAIPDSVTTIEEGAFNWCTHLTTMTIPDHVTNINQHTFASCTGLQNVVLGSGVKNIGWYAFYNCPKLASVYFKGNAPATIDGEAFYKTSATMYYPEGNSTWTSDKQKNYGGVLTWKTWSEEKNPLPDEPTKPTVPAKPAAPAAPKLTGVTNSSKGIQVKWNKVSDVSGYRIFRKAGSSKSWQTVATVNSSTTSYVDTSVSNGTTYRYTVRPYAKNNAGTTWGKYNSSGLVTVRLATSKLSSAANVKGQKMTIKWARNNQASGYQVQYATNSKFSSGRKTVNVSGNKNVSKTISKLSKNKKYYVRVRSYRTTGGKNYYSGWSNVRNVTIKQ